MRKSNPARPWPSGVAGPWGNSPSNATGCLSQREVIAIDRVPERLEMARKHGKAETIDFSQVKVYDQLMEMTKGRGPDRCIDAVGAEAHGTGSLDAFYDKVKTSLMLGTDRSHVLRETIFCCRKGGTISMPGVYLGFPDKIPFGAFVNKNLTMKSGQTHVAKYHKMLLKKIEDGEIDPSFVVTHRLPLSEAPEAYKTFRDKKDGCIKVVLNP